MSPADWFVWVQKSRQVRYNAHKKRDSTKHSWWIVNGNWRNERQGPHKVNSKQWIQQRQWHRFRRKREKERERKREREREREREEIEKEEIEINESEINALKEYKKKSFIEFVKRQIDVVFKSAESQSEKYFKYRPKIYFS